MSHSAWVDVFPSVQWYSVVRVKGGLVLVTEHLFLFLSALSTARRCEIYLWYIWEKKQMQKSLRLERKAGETLLWHYEWKEQLADSRRCTHTWGWYTGPALEGSSSGHCWTDPVLTDEPILSDDMGQPRSPGCYQVILSPRKLSDRVLQERMWTCD